MAVADGLPAAGLVLLSYPLHPPGKPDTLRVDHFSSLDLPCLFISGDKDPFGTPAEFKKYLKAIPGDVTWLTVPGAHDPRGQDEVIADYVREWIRNLR
jgi:predicted alpha/beta-hydrolase family hydrolase